MRVYLQELCANFSPKLLPVAFQQHTLLPPACITANPKTQIFLIYIASTIYIYIHIFATRWCSKYILNILCFSDLVDQELSRNHRTLNNFSEGTGMCVGGRELIIWSEEWYLSAMLTAIFQVQYHSPSWRGRCPTSHIYKKEKEKVGGNRNITKGSVFAMLVWRGQPSWIWEQNG